jgi:hypothetical protein
MIETSDRECRLAESSRLNGTVVEIRVPRRSVCMQVDKRGPIRVRAHVSLKTCNPSAEQAVCNQTMREQRLRWADEGVQLLFLGESLRPVDHGQPLEA